MALRAVWPMAWEGSARVSASFPAIEMVVFVTMAWAHDLPEGNVRHGNHDVRGRGRGTGRRTTAAGRANPVDRDHDEDDRGQEDTD